MARKTTTYTVQTPGSRDLGRVFLITEMSAAQGEDWAMRAILALMKGNPSIPENFEHTGMAGVAELGLKMLGGLDPTVLRPLMAELMACVQIQPDPSRPGIFRPVGFEGDIEEIATLVLLKKEVLALHLDPLRAVAPWISDVAAAIRKRADSQNTQISPEPSAP